MWRFGLLVLAGCGALIKPPEPDRRLHVETQGTSFESDRGYRFVVMRERSANVVRIDVRYPVGSVDDPIGKEGLAHLVEHLLTEVEVTHDGVRTTLDGELGRIALSYNAHTTTEYTSYEALALPAALEDLIRVEADRLTVGCAGISRELFEREREVVRNELREHGGGGGTELLRKIYEAIYPSGHPYRRIDSGESVAKITYEDVCAFVVGPYRRGTVIVAISGAVDVAATQAAVAKHFTRVPRRLPASPVAIAPLQPQPGTVKMTGGVDEPMLLVTWPLPPMSAGDYRILQIGWQELAANLERYAFLYQWGHSADTTVFGGPRAPVLGVSIVLSSSSELGEAKDRVGSAVRDMLYDLARPGDDRQTSGWVRRWEAEAEKVLARWDSLGARNKLYSDFQQFEPTASVTGRLDELSTATPLGARKLAETWLAASRARFILIEPSGGSEVGGGGGVFTGVVEQHGARVDGALADRPLPIPAVSLRMTIQRYTLANGLTVVLWPDGATPLVNGRLVVDAGSADDPFGKEGVSQTVGAADVYPDSMVFFGRTLSNRVDDVIRSLSSELRVPGYGLNEEQKKYLVARLEPTRVKERAAYEADVLIALYGEGHPYARNSITAAGVRHLSQDSVESWARAHITPKNSTLILAGKFDADLIKRHIAYNTEHVANGRHTRDVAIDPRSTHSFITGTRTKPSPTVEIGVHFVGGRGVDPDYPKRLVLEAVLDSQLTQLREKRAITYGFYAGYSPRRGGGMWTIGGEVDATRAAEAGTAIVSILADMRRDPETYRASFVLARQKVMESLLANSTGSAEVAEQLVLMARFGLDEDFFDGVMKSVAQLTLGDFHAFLTKELDSKTQVFGAFGNNAPVRAAIDAARAFE